MIYLAAAVYLRICLPAFAPPCTAGRKVARSARGSRPDRKRSLRSSSAKIGDPFVGVSLRAGAADHLAAKSNDDEDIAARAKPPAADVAPLAIAFFRVN